MLLTWLLGSRPHAVGVMTGWSLFDELGGFQVRRAVRWSRLDSLEFSDCTSPDECTLMHRRLVCTSRMMLALVHRRPRANHDEDMDKPCWFRTKICYRSTWGVKKGQTGIRTFLGGPHVTF